MVDRPPNGTLMAVKYALTAVRVKHLISISLTTFITRSSTQKYIERGTMYSTPAPSLGKLRDNARARV